MKKLTIAVAILVMVCVGASSVAAMSHGAAGPKIFWTASGLFGPLPISVLLPSYPKDQDHDIMIPINMWIIDHPKGLMVFDTGNNVAISDGNCTSHWNEGFCGLLQPSQARGDVIDKQLEKVGLSAGVAISDGNCKSHWNSWICDNLQPSQTRAEVIDKLLEKVGYRVGDVKIVITSHSHLDHIGNIEMFPNAIHVIQKKELYQAWWPEKFQRGGAHVMADYDEARDFTYFELNGDYDLFGDGSVVIISTPGHTLGHQSVKVRLNDTGTVILAQDAVWIKENLEGHPAGLNYSILDYTNSVNRIKMIRDIENAQVWMGHSMEQYEVMGEKWYQ
jgi:glyoxylase-like metal-dependent hydrolase (beta-lactamase superfamily II)